MQNTLTQCSCKLHAVRKMHLEVLKINVYYLSVRGSQVDRGVEIRYSQTDNKQIRRRGEKGGILSYSTI